MASRSPAAKKKMPRLRWVPWSLALKKDLDKRSGAYAIRRRDSKSVVYVGESHHGRLYKTMARHFYLPASKGASFATDRPSEYEVAWQVTSTGARPRSGSKAPDQSALNKQAKWIAALKPFHNKDDGMSAGERSGASYRKHRAKQEAEERDADPWGGLLNPSSPLTELGKLTAIETVKHEWVWNLRDAPTLAYDKTGRLFIVYAGKVVRPSDGPEKREYLRTHWGRPGDGVVRDGAIAKAPFTVGEISTRICYTTQKGLDRKLVDYVHEWGEGGPRQWKAPRLVAHSCAKCGPRCNGKGALALAGGTYVVSGRGIVG